MLLNKIDRYLRAHHMPETKFGRLAVNDPRLVQDMRHGRQVRPATAARVEAFLSRIEA